MAWLTPTQSREVRAPRSGAAPESADARRLRIRSARLVTSLFAGEYRSVFRGRGIEFE
jgi:hypothetical protein